MKIAITASVLSISFFLGGCNQDHGQTAWWEGEEERIELVKQIELKKYRYDQFLGSDFEDLQKVRSASEKLSATKKELESRYALVAAEVNSLNEQWSGFRESMIRAHRQRALGKSFDKLVLASGRTFENASVTAINDSGVTIRHSDGSARLRFEDLNAGQRWLFGLEEDLAIAAHQKESQSAAEYERWVDTRLASNEAKAKEAAETARQDRIAANSARADLLASQTASANVSPLSRPSTSSSYRSNYSGYRSNYSSYRTYTPVYRVYYNTPSYNYCSPAVTRYPSFPVQPNRLPYTPRY